MVKHGKPKVSIIDQGASIVYGLGKQYCAQQGMEICYIAPEVHKSNGLVERIIKTIIDKIRKLLFEKKLSDHYWSYVLQEVVNFICGHLMGLVGGYGPI